MFVKVTNNEIEQIAELPVKVTLGNYIVFHPKMEQLSQLGYQTLLDEPEREGYTHSLVLENGVVCHHFELIPPPTAEELAEQARLEQEALEQAQALAEQKRLQDIENARISQICSIKTQLKEIDDKSIRALRNSESDRLTVLENQAVTLRQQLAELQAQEQGE